MAKDCRKSVVTIVTWLLCCTMYLCLGMVIFVAIEAEHTEKIISDKQELRDILQTEFQTKLNISQDKVDLLMDRISEAFSPLPVRWTYLNALSLTIQTITTIGYGYIAPLTTAGRVFCIFYALFGIPLAALLLQATGNAIYGFINYSIVTVEKKIMKEPAENADFKSLIGSMILLCLVILIFAAVFGYGEDQYMEGVYGWFITLTTIGFGDVIPGRNKTHLFFIWLRIFFNFIGLSFTASVLSSLGSWIGSRNINCKPPCNCCNLTGRMNIDRQCVGHDGNDVEMNQQVDQKQDTGVGASTL